GAGLGKNNLVDVNEIAISRQLMAIKSILVDFYYIHLFVKSKYQYFQDAGVGIAIPGIGRDDILYMKIPLPPLPEQRRIVAKVEKLMYLCDQLEVKTEQSQNHSEKLLKAVIHEVLAG
ncbi:MAG: restriction endonuclease subunit S, partial [Candidatus Thermoplasmatota archaeon]|nr:restriction endonuclease subunit S [Candidatus Thermoplasmatota archaeon]